jgi:hypothetical protein
VREDERLVAFLRETLPPISTATPSRDLWPVIARRRPRVNWSWVDLALAGGVCVAFLWQPGWFFWLSYHF